MSRFPILQSGFISLVETGLKKFAIDEASLSKSILMKDHNRVVNAYFYSEEITLLFERWMSNPSAMKDIDFRERVIQSAFDAFGTTVFYQWIMLQSNQATVGDMHKVFLTETLEYLLLDTARPTRTVQWIRLIEASSKSRALIIDVNKYFPDIHDSNNSNVVLPGSMDKLLQIWLSKPDGFQDLLVTLFVIFGSRSHKTDVADISA